MPAVSDGHGNAHLRHPPSCQTPRVRGGANACSSLLVAFISGRKMTLYWCETIKQDMYRRTYLLPAALTRDYLDIDHNELTYSRIVVQTPCCLKALLTMTGHYCSFIYLLFIFLGASLIFKFYYLGVLAKASVI